MQWDIFCQVIDNFGDIGVCWRLCAQLSALGHKVRLWVDDASALQWMAPTGALGVAIHAWEDAKNTVCIPSPDIVIEAFGCKINPEFIANNIINKSDKGKKTPWINLEYLSAESYVERYHTLPSLIMSGAGAGCTRWFFYPGFTTQTGGLLREHDLLTRQAVFDSTAWRLSHGVAVGSQAIALFCYEPPALADWLASLDAHTHVLVTPGRTNIAVQHCMSAFKQPASNHNERQAKHSNPHVSHLDFVNQSAFDEMLWACDLNMVRGEDSLIRALWAGQALVWHIYPQDDQAHHAKLLAFLDWLAAPPSLRQFHLVWNGIHPHAPLPLVTHEVLHEWRTCIQAARVRLLQQDDLVTQLIRFAIEKS